MQVEVKQLQLKDQMDQDQLQGIPTPVCPPPEEAEVAQVAMASEEDKNEKNKKEEFSILRIILLHGSREACVMLSGMGRYLETRVDCCGMIVPVFRGFGPLNDIDSGRESPDSDEQLTCNTTYVRRGGVFNLPFRPSVASHFRFKFGAALLIRSLSGRQWCPQCKAPFGSWFRLWEHCRNRNLTCMRIRKSAAMGNEKEARTDYIHHCVFCKKGFHLKATLSAHKKKLHADAPPRHATSSKQLK